MNVEVAGVGLGVPTTVERSVSVARLSLGSVWADLRVELRLKNPSPAAMSAAGKPPSFEPGAGELLVEDGKGPELGAGGAEGALGVGVGVGVVGVGVDFGISGRGISSFGIDGRGAGVGRCAFSARGNGSGEGFWTTTTLPLRLPSRTGTPPIVIGGCLGRRPTITTSPWRLVPNGPRSL